MKVWLCFYFYYSLFICFVVLFAFNHYFICIIYLFTISFKILLVWWGDATRVKDGHRETGK